MQPWERSCCRGQLQPSARPCCACCSGRLRIRGLHDPEARTRDDGQKPELNPGGGPCAGGGHSLRRSPPTKPLPVPATTQASAQANCQCGRLSQLRRGHGLVHVRQDNAAIFVRQSLPPPIPVVLQPLYVSRTNGIYAFQARVDSLGESECGRSAGLRSRGERRQQCRTPQTGPWARERRVGQGSRLEEPGHPRIPPPAVALACPPYRGLVRT